MNNVVEAMQTVEKDNLADFIINSAVDKARDEIKFWDNNSLSEKNERIFLAVAMKESIEMICNLLEMITEETGELSKGGSNGQTVD